MSYVRVNKLVKKFSGVSAVDGISMDVNKGEFVVLLGPSGCGKTTTLRCIAGLEDPDEGDIFIEGVRVNDMEPKERNVAMVFQNYALYPHMTVYNNIAYPLKMRKMGKKETDKSVKEISKLLGIERLLSRKPRELSGGEQQRVALGRALVRQPRVFLMDEPLSNLDMKLRIYMRTELKRLQKEIGTTTIYVTHDQTEAMALADRIIVINEGKVQQEGSPSEIYDKPANTFTAGFIGNPPMNLIRTTIRVQDGLVNCDTGQFKFQLTEDQSKQVREKVRGDSVYTGVEPEDLLISDQQLDGPGFQAEVFVFEPMGPNNLVNIKAGNDVIKAVTPSTRRYEQGTKVWVGLDVGKVRIYDGETTKLVV